MQMLIHVGHVAGDGDHRDVGLPAGEHAIGVILDDDTRLVPESRDLAEIAPDLLRTARQRSDDVDAFLEHHPGRDRVHRPDAVDDSFDPPHALSFAPVTERLPATPAGSITRRRSDAGAEQVRSLDDLDGAQRQPQVNDVLSTRQAARRQRLDSAHAVDERLAVDVEFRCRALR